MTYSNTYSSPSSPTNFNPFSGMGMRKGGRPSLFPGSGDGSTLNLDFTTGVLDSRLTFSRASTATFVNSSGYVEWAASNEMTYSQSQDSETLWNRYGTGVVRTAGQTDPNGGTSAVKLVYTATAGDAVISRSVTTNIGISYTISMWMRADSGTLTNVRFARAATPTGAFFPTLTTIWQRVSLSFTATNASDGIEIRVLTAGSPQTATFHVYGAQLESGSTVRTYQPALAAAAYHAPRFDYSPTNIGEPRGLLIEGQGANYVKSSNTLIGNGWTLLGDNLPTVTAGGGAVSPDGITNATKVVFGTTPGSSASRLYINTSFVTYPYTQSVWLKSNSGENQTIWWLGTVSVALTVTPVWQRFQLTITASANLPGYLYFSNESNVTNPDISIWGAQLELGSGASSLIPTGASQVTRNADLCYMSDISSLSYSATNGSMFYEGSFYKINSISYPTRMGFLTAAGGDQAFEIFVNGTTIFSGIRSVSATNEITRTIATNTNYKFATSFNTASSSQVRCSLNGAAVVGSGTSAITATRTPTVFGFTRSGYDLYFPSGTIKTAKYWNTTLTDADLVSKST